MNYDHQGILQARKHLLVLARHKGLDQLADICKEHLQLLKTMHAVELKWADKLFKEDAWMIVRLGYHSVRIISCSTVPCYYVFFSPSLFAYFLILLFQCVWTIKIGH